MPGTALLDLTHAVGSVSGRDLDKFAAHELRPLIGPVLGMPLIEDGCSAWLECRLYAEPHTEDAYDTCFAEVVAASVGDAFAVHELERLAQQVMGLGGAHRQLT